jgi:hypothetical protein
VIAGEGLAGLWVDPEHEDEVVGCESSHADGAEMESTPMVTEAQGSAVRPAVGAALGAGPDVVVLQLPPSHAARATAPIVVPGDDLVPALDSAGFGRVVSLNEVDEDDLDDTPGWCEGVFQG